MRVPSAREEGNLRLDEVQPVQLLQQPSTAALLENETPGPSSANGASSDQEPQFKTPYPVCRKRRKMFTIHKEGRLLLEDIRTFVNMRPVEEMALNDKTPPWEQIELPPEIDVVEARNKWKELENNGLNISDDDYRNAMMFVQASEYLETFYMRTLLHWLSAPLGSRTPPSKEDRQRAHRELSQLTEWSLRRVMDYCYEHLHVRQCVEWLAFIEHLISHKDSESNGDAPRLPTTVRKSGEEKSNEEGRRGMYDIMARVMLNPAHFSNELYTKPWLGTMDDAEAWVRAGFFPQEDYDLPEKRKEHVEALWEVAKCIHRWKTLVICSGRPSLKVQPSEGRSHWTQDWSVGTPFGVLRDIARFRLDAIPARFKQREDGSWIGPQQVSLQLLRDQQSKLLLQQRLQPRAPLTIRDALQQVVWREEEFPVPPQFARPITSIAAASAPSSSSSSQNDSAANPAPAFAVPKVPAARSKRSPRKRPAPSTLIPSVATAVDVPLPPSFSVIVSPSEPAASTSFPMEPSYSIHTKSTTTQSEVALRFMEHLQRCSPSNAASDDSSPSTSAAVPTNTSPSSSSVHAPSLTPPSSSSCSPIHASPVKRKNGVAQCALSFDNLLGSPDTPSPPQSLPEQADPSNGSGLTLEQQWQILHQLLQHNLRAEEHREGPPRSTHHLKRRSDNQSLEPLQKRATMQHRSDPEGVLNLSRHPLQQLQQGTAAHPFRVQEHLMGETSEDTRAATQAYVDTLSQSDLLRMEQLLHTQPNSSAAHQRKNKSER